MRDVVKLRENEGGALVVGQSRDVGQDRAQVRARGDLDGQGVPGRLRHISDDALAAGAQLGQAAVAGDGIQPGARRDGRLGAHEVAVGGQERELGDILGRFTGAQHVPAECEHGPVVAVKERLEGSLGARVHLLDQALIGRQP